MKTLMNKRGQALLSALAAVVIMSGALLFYGQGNAANLRLENYWDGMGQYESYEDNVRGFLGNDFLFEIGQKNPTIDAATWCNPITISTNLTHDYPHGLLIDGLLATSVGGDIHYEFVKADISSDLTILTVQFDLYNEQSIIDSMADSTKWQKVASLTTQVNFKDIVTGVALTCADFRTQAITRAVPQAPGAYVSYNLTWNSTAETNRNYFLTGFVIAAE